MTSRPARSRSAPEGEDVPVAIANAPRARRAVLRCRRPRSRRRTCPAVRPRCSGARRRRKAGEVDVAAVPLCVPVVVWDPVVQLDLEAEGVAVVLGCLPNVADEQHRRMSGQRHVAAGCATYAHCGGLAPAAARASSRCESHQLAARRAHARRGRDDQWLPARAARRQHLHPRLRGDRLPGHQHARRDARGPHRAGGAMTTALGNPRADHAPMSGVGAPSSSLAGVF